MSTPTNVVTELLIDGAWVDLTALGHVRQAAADSGGGHTITRPTVGLDPTECEFTVSNVDGRYSPRNPLSPHYGLLGRNTPVKVTLPDLVVDNWLTMQGYQGPGASTPDHVSLDITGDIDIRIEYSAWNRHTTLMSKWQVAGNNQSWALFTDDAGYLWLWWSTDGSGIDFEVSTEPVPARPGERVRVRATLDVNNGSGGHTTTFWTSDTDLAGTWSVLGSTLTTTGVTSIHAGAAALTVGDNFDIGGGNPLSGRIYEAQVRSSIGGAIVARPDWRNQVVGQSVHTDTAGRVWTRAAGVVVDDPNIRFAGEIATWPPRWTVGEHDAWVNLTAYGILHRLGQGRKALRSPIYRNLARYTSVAWWTCEDGGTATRMGSAVPNGPPAVISDVTFEDDPTLLGAAGVAVLGTAGSIIGQAAPHASTNNWTVLVFMRMTALPASTTRLMTISSTGSAHTWTFDMASNGVTTISAIGTSGLSTVVLDSDTASLNATIVRISEGWVALTLGITQTGGNVDWVANWHMVGDGPAFFSSGINSFAGQGGAFQSLRITADPVLGATGLKVSHLFAVPGALPFVTFAFAEASSGHNLEAAAARFIRLCGEQGVANILIGDPADTHPMGPQRVGTFLDLLAEIEAADGGRLYETRGARSLSYRTGRSLYNQIPTELPYTSLAPPLAPVDDLKAVRNDVTVTREAGTSYRSVQETGPLNVQDPAADPDGVGVIDEAVTLNLAVDSQVKPAADWRRHAGTLDESRYPNVTIDLRADPWPGDPAGTAAIAALNPGDLVELTGLPAFLPPDPTEQLVRGYTETLDAVTHKLTLDVDPGRLHRVGVLGVTTRVNTRGSVTTADFDAGTDTALTVQRAPGTRRLWITTSSRPQNFPFDVMAAGVRLTVTAAAGTSDPQTLTVTATPVNGVVKTIPAGTPVRVAEPWRLAR